MPLRRMFFSESSSYKANEDGYPSQAEDAEAGHSIGRLEKSTENRKGKLYDTRYFIIKSLNHHNIQLSIEKGIWATQVMNEPILEEAFHVRSLLCNLMNLFFSFNDLQRNICLFCRILLKSF